MGRGHETESKEAREEALGDERPTPGMSYPVAKALAIALAAAAVAVAAVLGPQMLR